MRISPTISVPRQRLDGSWTRKSLDPRDPADLAELAPLLHLPSVRMMVDDALGRGPAAAFAAQPAVV